MDVAFKVLASLVLGCDAAAPTGTLASVIATGGYSAADRQTPSNVFLWGGGIGLFVALAIGRYGIAAARRGDIIMHWALEQDRVASLKLTRESCSKC